jgi:hypothetical protein
MGAIKTSVLQSLRSYMWLFKNLLESVHRFLGGLKKAICSYHATLKQLHTEAREVR